MTKTEFVTADMMIGDVVLKYPVTAQIMMSYGLHCVGCGASGFETIKQGASGHGMMDEEEVNDLIQEMNEAIAEREVATTSGEPLSITNKAVVKIKEFADKEEKKEDIFLRVGVQAGGCSGLKYSLEFEHEPEAEDTIIPLDGIDVRVNQESVDLLHGAVLDYVDGLHGSGFKIDNPNATQKCGCGKSFS